MTDTSPDADPRQKIDTTVPHSTRIWNYRLGGKDNYVVDRDAGDDPEGSLVSHFPQP